MSKESEAYERLCSHLDYDNDDYMFNGNYEEDNEIVEKALKALKIIKDHKLLNYVLKNPKCASMYHLDKSEIEFLEEVIYEKEVLL